MGKTQKESRMKMFLECLRYFPVTRVQLDCPIVAIGAMDDEVVPMKKMGGWAAWTAVWPIVLPVPGGGGHLFVITKPDFVASMILKFIRASFESSSSSESIAISLMFS